MFRYLLMSMHIFVYIPASKHYSKHTRYEDPVESVMFYVSYLQHFCFLLPSEIDSQGRKLFNTNRLLTPITVFNSPNRFQLMFKQNTILLVNIINLQLLESACDLCAIHQSMTHQNRPLPSQHEDESTKTAVLNLFRLADHLTNFVSVHGPQKIFYTFLEKF